MAVPFRISVVQLTMEPVPQMVELGKAIDRAGFDVFWLGEAYPWWRKHTMEARSSTSLSALIAAATERVALGWGIISPYTRHPLQIAMEARVLQEVAGPGRFLLGLGPSKIFMRAAGAGDGRPARPLTAIREAVEIVRRALDGEGFTFEGKEFAAEVPPLDPTRRSRRTAAYRSTSPAPRRRSRRLRARSATGCSPPASRRRNSSATPARTWRRAPARQAGTPNSLDLGSVIVASIDEDRDRGRAGAREIAAMYLANKVQNITSAADVLLEKAGIDPEEIRPVADALDRGGAGPQPRP